MGETKNGEMVGDDKACLCEGRVTWSATDSYTLGFTLKLCYWKITTTIALLYC